jgi:F-type H+-transporting ATPase subunit gamma
VADEVFSEFVSENVDKVELIYTRFVSLIASRPVVQTLLPLAASGQVCTVNGVCVDAKDDEVFALTSEDGKFAVKREAAPVDTSGAVFDGVITFEQDPNQILDALLPLYMNSQVLRALQESIASELAARMTAMGAASDNAKSLSKALNLSYNRQRQAKITGEIIGACAPAAVSCAASCACFTACVCRGSLSQRCSDMRALAFRRLAELVSGASSV